MRVLDEDGIEMIGDRFSFWNQLTENTVYAQVTENQAYKFRLYMWKFP